MIADFYRKVNTDKEPSPRSATSVSGGECGWHKINPTTGKVPIEVDHIDGDWRNNRPENLRLLCPNCHSLTPTYKALNKGKGKNRYTKEYSVGTTHINYEVKKRVSQLVPPKEGKLTRVKQETARKVRKRKVERPSKENLETMIAIMPMTSIGKQYGVSDNAVRRWAKSYGIVVPNRQGYWAKRNYELGRSICSVYVIPLKTLSEGFEPTFL